MIRRATVSDAPRIYELLNHFVRRGEILPRPLADIYQSIRDWVIVEKDGAIIGCGSLLIMWEDLAEIRSLVVSDAHQRNGYGCRIVSQLLEDARAVGIPRVFALTRIVPFFEKLGFCVTTKEALPRKVYKDCMHCLKFPICDETAVVLDLQ